MDIKRFLLTATSIVLLPFLSCNATAETSTTKVSVSVTVNAVSCQINNNKAITAEFGPVLIEKLAQATASVPVSITCDDEPDGTVWVAIKGTASSFDGQALQTDVKGLGITITSPTSETLYLNTYYDVESKFGLASKTGTFTLTAHLKSDGKTELAGGDFNASATLVVQVS